MVKKIIFLNNDVTYFYLHRKKFVSYFEEKKYNISYIFPKNQKGLLIKFIEKNFFNKELKVNFFSFERRSMNIYKEFISIINLYSIIKKENPDLIYTTTLKLSLYLLLINFFSQKKIINNFSGLGYLYVNNSIKIQLIRFFFELMLKLFSNKNFIYIFENKRDLDYFVNKNILKSSKCFYTNGVGVDIHKFKFLKRKFTEIFNVTMVSRIEKSKGVYEYLEVVRSLESSSKYKFHLIGKIPENADIKLIKLLTKCKNQKNFHYSSWTDNIVNIYNITNIAVLSSHMEGMSVFLMEALSCGLPIVATKIPSNEEIVQNDINGYLVPLYSPQEIIIKLNLITENFEKYSNMSINSRKICEKKFDEKIILEKFRKIIEQEC